jgi:hypothetical protein
MPGPDDSDPATLAMAQTLQQIMDQQTQTMAQITMINGRLHSHDTRMAQLEKRTDDATESGSGPHLPASDSPDLKAGGSGLADPNAPLEVGGDGGHDRGNSSRGHGGLGGHDGDDFCNRPRHDGGWCGQYDHDRQEDAGYRRPKLNFPSFDRETDPLPWINKCETYFRGMRTMAEEKVWITFLHLDSVATEWYYVLERDHGILSWARFAEFMNMRFGPPLHSNGLDELKELHCTGTVQEYQCQFSVLLCRCDDLSPSQQVMFTAGLGEQLRTDVELQAPTNLQSAMSLARAYE